MMPWSRTGESNWWRIEYCRFANCGAATSVGRYEGNRKQKSIRCGLVTPYGDIDVGHHLLRQYLVAWWHQTITWNNVDSWLVSWHSSKGQFTAIAQATIIASPPWGKCITMTSWWARWRLKSPASRVFTQPFIQAQMKENIKAPCHWPLCGEFTGEFPAQKASNAENVSIWWRHHGVRKISRHRDFMGSDSISYCCETRSRAD